MGNPRFAEYATSGAFSLALTRNQASSLAMLADGGHAPLALYGQSGSLERKGLVEILPHPTEHQPDACEYRPTHAGLLLAALLREAGLSNGPPDPVAAELASLRAQLAEARQVAVEARIAGRSARARQEAAERATEAAKLEVRRLEDVARGLRLKPGVGPYQAQPIVTLRDPTPNRSEADLDAALQELAT